MEVCAEILQGSVQRSNGVAFTFGVQDGSAGAAKNLRTRTHNCASLRLCIYVPLIRKDIRKRLLTNLRFFSAFVGATDYTLVRPTGSFQSGDTRSCTNITILPDNRVEGTESFTVTLTGNSAVEVGNTAGTATVVILDDDGEFRLWQVQHVIPCILATGL